MGPEAGIARTGDTDTVSKKRETFRSPVHLLSKGAAASLFSIGSHGRFEISSHHRRPASLLHDPSS
jgi:hypothetical protein